MGVIGNDMRKRIIGKFFRSVERNNQKNFEHIRLRLNIATNAPVNYATL